MKKWLLHIWCIGVLGMLAASCSQIIDDPIADGDCELETEEVKVTFTIAMGSPESGSRADIGSNDPWGNYDSEVEGNETMGNRYFDNKIEPNKLQVIICDASYNPIVEVEKLLYTQTATNVYTFTGSFTAEMSANNSYKIVVFANCPDVTISEGATASIWDTYIPMQMPTSGKTEDLTSIPMWGVRTITGYAFTPGTNTNIGTIFVLRAMAKVEIELDEAIADEYSLTGAKFNTYNKYVNCIPKGYNGYTYNNGTEDVVVTVGKTEDLRTISTFNPNSTTSGTELSFMTVIENRRLVAYVPEYDNDGSLKMTVNLKKGTQDEKDYDILFNDLSAATTTPFDVIRNHYYKYTITGVNDGLSANLTVTANEWNLQEVSVNYKAEPATDGKITWDTNVLQNGEVKLGGDAMYTNISFKLVGPTDGTWTATLIRTEGLPGAFSFNASQVVEQVSGNVGETATLTIHAMNETVTENCKAKLQIVVKTQDGTRTIDVTEMLNANHLIVQSK